MKQVRSQRNVSHQCFTSYETVYHSTKRKKKIIQFLHQKGEIHS